MNFWAWTLIFLAAAIVFAVLEMFVPSGGILAFLAVVTLLSSIALAFQAGPVFGGFYLLGLVVGVPILIGYMLKFWSQSFVGRQVLLHPEDDPALQPNAELFALKQLVGKHGVALSKMRLSGLVEVEGRRLNALSESESLEPGDGVIVVKVDGINIIVRKVLVEKVQVEKVQIETVQPEVEPTVVDPFA